jgi:hypothetical protein
MQKAQYKSMLRALRVNGVEFRSMLHFTNNDKVLAAKMFDAIFAPIDTLKLKERLLVNKSNRLDIRWSLKSTRTELVLVDNIGQVVLTLATKG